MLQGLFLNSKILFYSQMILTLLLFIYLVVNLNTIKRFLKDNFNKNDLLFILFISTFSFIIRLKYFWNFHYTNDEYMYIKSAKELYTNNFITWYTRLIWWPFLLFIVFSLFWFTSFFWFLISILFWVSSICIYYILLRLIFKKENIAIFSTLFFSILPFHVFWSGKLETNIPSLFFILLTLLICFIFHKTKDLKILYLSIFTTFFTTTIRWENMILYLILITIIFLNRWIIIKKNHLIKLIWVLFIWFFLTLPNYVNQYFFTNSQDWNYGDWNNIWLLNIFQNIYIFIGWFFENKLYFYYNIVTILWLFSLLLLIKNNYKNYLNWIFLLLFSCAFISLFVIYNLIWLKYVYWADRLYMEVYPLYIIGYWVWIELLLNKIKLKKTAFIIFFFLTLLNIFKIDNYMYWKTIHHDLQMKMSSDFKYIYDKKCIYITYDTFYYEWFVEDFKYAYNFEFISNDNFSKKILGKFPCTIFVNDKFCNDSSPWNMFFWPDKKSTNYYCNTMKNNFRLEPIKIYDNNIKYWYYLIIWKK